MTSDSPPSPSASRSARFAHHLRAFFRGDVDTFMDMYEADAVHAFPFGPEGMPREVCGRASIEAWMRRVPDLIDFDDPVTDLRLYEAPDTVTAEWTAAGRFRNGVRAEFHYVAVVTFGSVGVVRYNEYINPLELVPAFEA